METPAEQVRRWMAQILADKEMSVQGWADRAQVSRSTLFRALSEDYQNLTSTNTLRKLAMAAGVPMPTIVLSSGDDDPPPAMGAVVARIRGGITETTVQMPIRYECAAGAWIAREDFVDEPFGYSSVTPIQPYTPESQWLERVRGESFNREIPNGYLVQVVDCIFIGYEPRHGDTVIVVRRRAQGAFEERTLKQIQFTPRGLELWPRSFDDRYQTPLLLTEEGDTEEDVEVVIAAKVLRSFRDWE